MPHLRMESPLPGMPGLVASYPESGRSIADLANTLLREESTLTRAERELIATAVSRGNGCTFCEAVHSAMAAELRGCCGTIDALKQHPEWVSANPRLAALLAIAELVREDDRRVPPGTFARARSAGATDEDIHDTVLIAAFFCHVQPSHRRIGR